MISLEDGLLGNVGTDEVIFCWGRTRANLGGLYKGWSWRTHAGRCDLAACPLHMHACTLHDKIRT